MSRLDPPEDVVDGSIREQRAILRGYKDNLKTDKQKLKEAPTPGHVAISLTGEPILYDYIDDLLRAFHQRGFTTFLISNGTNPAALAKLRITHTAVHLCLRL